MTRLNTSTRSQYFGKPGNVDKIQVSTPWGMTAWCHKEVADIFGVACHEASQVSDWNPRRIDSYNYRPIRDSFSPSLHGWALAWDFFATGPGVSPPGGVWHPTNSVPPEFAAPFIRRGFVWGANFENRKDYPHIEWPGYPPAKVTAEEIEESAMAISNRVAIKLTKSGKGYWIAAADGGVFSFGDAPFHGSLGGKKLAKPITGFDATNDDKGYVMVAADGGVFTFGSVKFQGAATK